MLRRDRAFARGKARSMRSFLLGFAARCAQERAQEARAGSESGAEQSDEEDVPAGFCIQQVLVLVVCRLGLWTGAGKRAVCVCACVLMR